MSVYLTTLPNKLNRISYIIIGIFIMFEVFYTNKITQLLPFAILSVNNYRPYILLEWNKYFLLNTITFQEDVV